MTNLLQLYPRGYLGEAFVSGQAALDPSRPKKPSAHPNVEALYDQYIKRIGATTSFEFRRQVLAVALKAFGTSNFEIWVSSQRQSPLIGDTHNNFIDDTIRFISEGRRDLCVENWDALITSADHGERLTGHTEIAKEFFGFPSSGHHRYPRNRELIDVIQLWCSRPGGIEDMLCTMHVLFGNN